MSRIALFTARLTARKVGQDALGNTYFESRRVVPVYGRARRFVVLAKGSSEATLVPPEWHAWLHHTTASLPERPSYPWLKPHQPNATGTALAWRPKGHDYRRGGRNASAGDYEAWTPGS
ncbi:MAG: NADH:ubiquinone oxidoreductase subunit NDUFA12 [Acetobacteraceae bacterium]|nr:NADH:ubiquinone oxidoreductase subunit NDUFA12 [Acetobacteraceae bacterium]